MLLGKRPKDFDIVTNTDLDTLTEVLKSNGWKVNEAGKQFLVLIASKGTEQYEIALFRKDGTYSDGRRPDKVKIGTIEEDAERRDLTVNSIYYDVWKDKYIDPTGNGLKDIKSKTVRLNGKAKERIQEDYLRILRCYRFASTLNFTIEPKTLKACRTYFNTMCEKVAGERIRLEVEKMSGV